MHNVKITKKNYSNAFSTNKQTPTATYFVKAIDTIFATKMIKTISRAIEAYVVSSVSSTPLIQSLKFLFDSFRAFHLVAISIFVIVLIAFTLLYVRAVVLYTIHSGERKRAK